MINKFLDKLFNLQTDKLKHFFYGTFIGFIFVLMFGWAGIFSTLSIALLKEVVDYIEYSADGKTYNAIGGLWDVAFTVAPSILFFIISLVL